MARATFTIKRRKSDFKDENESLDIYLEEINRIPLIKQPEELELAKRIRSPKGDDVALEKLVKANLRFVVSVAKQYKGLPLADLINEGNIGLVKAAKRFDPYYKRKGEKNKRGKRKKKGKENKPVKFISYAVWWIRQAILVALAEGSRPVRLPLNRAGEVYKISRKKAELEQGLEKQVTINYVIEAFPDKNPQDIIDDANLLKGPISLDGPVGKDQEGDNWHEIFEDPTARNAEVDYSDEKLRQAVDDVLEELTSREEEIVNLYFGRNGERPMTLEEIGARFNLTRERIRQIKENALKRLRHVSRSKKLAPYHYS